LKDNRKRTKILEITSYPPPRAGWGVRVSFVREALIGSGHVCEVLNISPFSRTIPSQEYHTTTSGLDYFKKVFIRCLKGYRVHMHMNGDSPKGFFLTALAITISLLTFKRPVLTFHAGPYQKYFPQERAPLLTPLYKFIFMCSGRIICNDEAVKGKIIGYGIRPEKIIPIPAFSVQYLNYNPITINGSLSQFIVKKSPLISTYVFVRPEFYVENMIEVMTEVVKKHPDLGLIILGLDEGFEPIRALIQERGITDNIFFAGDQTHHSFLTILSKSDIYLRTPVKDGVCSSVLEALSLKVPVVASENNRRPESVITYDNNDTNDMVKVLDDVIRNLTIYKSKVVVPFIEDTVAREIKVLVDD
jgi:glycosyltransferase involved in cell wall biosynthesis